MYRKAMLPTFDQRNKTMGIWNTLKKLFRIGQIQVENGLQKLVSAEAQLQIIEHDTIDALEKQKANAQKLEASKLEFDSNFEKAQKDLTRLKTSCEVLKNKLIKEGKDYKEDDDMKLAAATYLEQQKLVEEFGRQKDEMDKMINRVEKMLKHLKLNKNLVHMKADMLRQKIRLYESKAVIDETGMVDINTTFGEVDELVQKMQFEQQAAQRVDDIVNGRETTQLANEADVDNFLNAL
jgi:hypothetical protein